MVLLSSVTDEGWGWGEAVKSGELISLARVGGRIFRGLWEESLKLKLSFKFILSQILLEI